MIWRVESVAKFRVLAQHLYSGTEENYEECQDSRRPDLVANRDAPDYKSGELQAEPKWPMKRARKMKETESKGA
jgi:hypothetical protein